MRVKGKLFAIDANVILRYLLVDDQELSAKSAEIMEGMEDGKIRVSCDPVILAEVVWVLTSFYKKPKHEIATALVPIIKAEGFIIPNKDRYLHALQLYAGPVGHFGDACACAAAADDCSGNLLSFDRKLSNIEGVNRLESA